MAEVPTYRSPGGGARTLTFSRPQGLAKIGQLPWGLILLISAIALMGTAMLYSATITNPTEQDLPLKHLIRFGVAFGLMMVLALVPIRWWMALSVPAYLVTLALLVGVELAGAVRGGAQRWLEIGPIALQPSELAKLTLILVLARYYHQVLGGGHGLLVHVPAIVLMVAPALLIFKQPDFGTTLAILAASGVIIFLAGISKWVIISGFVAALAAVVPVYTYVLEDYQRERVDTFVEQMRGIESTDALGDSYQIEQAKIAIGSGGLNGKGFTNGNQSQLDFIPEQHTDFILTVFAEELGFFGVTALLIAWGVILAWGLMIARSSANLFGRFAAAGAVATIGFYIVFNVGMVVGLLPVVGVPMPLVSYGGSAMITTMAAFGLILSVHLHRDDNFTVGGLF